MCGIIGYTGHRPALPIILEGLGRLEYRGYDSSGVAVATPRITVHKDAVRVAELARSIPDVASTIGIGHTRWATHGAPCQVNAHPQIDCTGKIAVVHNGIITNYQKLKDMLSKEGHKFISETDTEVIPHLIEKYYDGDLKKAVVSALSNVEGSYAIVAMMENEPRLIATRKDSPLIIGIGDHENFVASDVPAILDYTDRVIYLEDEDIAVITKDSVKITRGDREAERKEHKISWTIKEAQKSGHEHFMLKEIHEQPLAISAVISGTIPSGPPYILPERFSLTAGMLRRFKRVILIGTGASHHIALIGCQMVEAFTSIPAQAEVSSEFAYREPLLDQDTLVIALSQSGETADTLTAIKQSKMRGAYCFGICCVQGSTITRLADAVSIVASGPEIAVSATKSFTAMLTVTYLLAIYMGLQRGVIGSKRAATVVEEIATLPQLVQQVLDREDKYRMVAERIQKYSTLVCIGRGVSYPIALECASLLEQIAYFHVEAQPAGEVKHGTFAIIGNDTPVIAIAPTDILYSSMVSNIKEVKARGAPIIALGNDDNSELPALVDHFLSVPRVSYFAGPILSVIPLQLLAYHLARIRGNPIDYPRNLAKSVTVE